MPRDDADLGSRADPLSGAPGVVWLSLDPVRRKVDFYPLPIAQRIEASLSAGEEHCVLGADFWNATIHFNSQSGECYQTTPGQHLGRGGFKQPGYRTVKRVVKPADQNQITLYGMRVQGEWRLMETGSQAEWTFTEVVPPEYLIIAAEPDAEPPRAWQGTDLEGNAMTRARQAVIVWQWCRGTPEANGDLMRLGDDVWCPYMQGHNAQIEGGFAAEAGHAVIDMETRVLKIAFNPGSTFAFQRDEAAGKERLVRRTVKTAQELWAMLEAMQAPVVGAFGDVPDWQAPGTVFVPHDYFCPITQDIMRDPVKTQDNHTYDRQAILQWFTQHDTSPLTGLSLPTKDLTPNDALKAQIDAFLVANPSVVVIDATGPQ